MRLFHPLALALLASGPLNAQAQPLGPRFTTEWVGLKPACEDPAITRLPGQPQVGLVAFKTRCPGEARDRVVSARVSATALVYLTPSPIPRGSAPSPAGLQQSEMKISTPAQWPLEASALSLVSARRDLPAGSPLLARDFESKLLWRGGETVAVKSFVGMVSADTQGVATSLGREGEMAGAKLESGKIVQGLAKTGPSGHWIEIRQP